MAFLLQLVPPVAAMLAGSRGVWPDAGALLTVGMLSAASALLAPITLVLANLLLYPVEALLRQRYINMARARLRSQTHNTTIIGITGSYGKTSTKDILTHILGTRYRVSKTPKSFNTLMGICKSINDGDLRPGDNYFVAELGAYIPGEIRRLAQLLKPKVGVLTAVGPQHLERFGSIENVARAKYELIEALPADGLAVFNADNDICYRLARGTHHVPVALYGIEKHPDEVYLRAEGMQVTREGLRFTMVRPQTGEKVAVRTRLLGRHQVSNILAASTVALWAGLTLNDIAAAIAMIQPTPHRLELKQGAGGITILDDAYNSNPEGARNALQILSEFRDGKRILVTPGLVELGELEPVENRRLGSHAAGACDVAILVGRDRTDFIRQGLVESGFPADNVIQVPTLNEAIARLRAIASPGDTVLLLNDLPDTYELVAG
jgi:UDP-N-acetylmuramoyl-tripeptide--D-alanyl-D-alanine ligase